MTGVVEEMVAAVPEEPSVCKLQPLSPVYKLEPLSPAQSISER